MKSNLINIIIIIYVFKGYSVLTDVTKLIQIENNLLYSRLQTPSDISLFYQKLLQSNGIDDITRIHRMITQDAIQQLDLEHEVSKGDLSTERSNRNRLF
jgi:hypothetical protein